MGNVSLWQMLLTSVPEVDISEGYSIPAAQTILVKSMSKCPQLNNTLSHCLFTLFNFVLSGNSCSWRLGWGNAAGHKDLEVTCMYLIVAMRLDYLHASFISGSAKTYAKYINWQSWGKSLSESNKFNKIKFSLFLQYPPVSHRPRLGENSPEHLFPWRLALGEIHGSVMLF